MNIRKVHVVGSEKSGKTCLIEAMINGKAPANFIPTEVYVFRIKQKDDFKIQLMESPEKSISQHTHGKHTTVVVVDLTERVSFQHAKHLLSETSLRYEDCLIVGTHADELTHKVVGDLEFSSLAQFRSHKTIQVSSTTGENIPNLMVILGKKLGCDLSMAPAVAAVTRETLATGLQSRIDGLANGWTNFFYKTRKEGKSEALEYVQSELRTTNKPVASIVATARQQFPELKAGVFFQRSEAALDDLIITARRHNLS